MFEFAYQSNCLSQLPNKSADARIMPPMPCCSALSARSWKVQTVPAGIFRTASKKQAFFPPSCFAAGVPAEPRGAGFFFAVPVFFAAAAAGFFPTALLGPASRFFPLFPADLPMPVLSLEHARSLRKGFLDDAQISQSVKLFDPRRTIVDHQELKNVRTRGNIAFQIK